MQARGAEEFINLPHDQTPSNGSLDSVGVKTCLGVNSEGRFKEESVIKNSAEEHSGNAIRDDTQK